MPTSEPHKITLIGNYPPRQCGIATFTQDIRLALLGARPDRPVPVVAVTDALGPYDYPNEVRFEIAEQQSEHYRDAGQFINNAGGQVACVQHEFGIFGGDAGEHLLELMDSSDVPFVTTLHTVLSDPNPDQKRVFEKVAQKSARLVTMSEKGREILRETWQVPEHKIEVIPHGIPDVPFTDPAFYKEQFNLQGREVILTFGLIGPGKGIEDGIKAMPAVAKKHPDALYVILGATHPNLIRHEGEKYREELEALVEELGVQDNVRFVNQYTEFEELLEWIGAADLYLTPYLNEAQITSGTLAYSYGAGKAVVSTPYWHAAEILSEERGCLVKFSDPQSIADGITGLLDDPARCDRVRKAAYLAGREMTWEKVGKRYHEVFEEVLREASSVASANVERKRRNFTTESALPEWNDNHLRRMSDSTGMFQHARLHLPWFEHGYCTDDNARALIYTAEREAAEQGNDDLLLLQASYAAFLEHAFDHETRRFRNFLSFDRKWMEKQGSEDSHGRAVWALGRTALKTRQKEMRSWALDIFEQSFQTSAHFTSPRSWAFSILGMCDYLEIFPGDRTVRNLVTELSDRLIDLHNRVHCRDWNWFEDSVTYDNARICEALLRASITTDNMLFEKVGLETLSWLQKAQTGLDGCFRPVGSEGFWQRGQEPAWYDQQPLEAAAGVAASSVAHRISPTAGWDREARRCFDWFVGRNDLKVSLFDKDTGGCYDGLRSSRVNRNQGAESLLSFWLGLSDVRAMEAGAGDQVEALEQKGAAHA